MVLRKAVGSEIQRIMPNAVGGAKEFQDFFALEGIDPDAVLQPREAKPAKSSPDRVAALLSFFAHIKENDSPFFVPTLRLRNRRVAEEEAVQRLAPFFRDGVKCFSVSANKFDEPALLQTLGGSRENVRSAFFVNV